MKKVFGVLVFGAALMSARVGNAATIKVTEATYGGNCKAATQNALTHVEQACNGKASCAYEISHTTLGDPAPGCAKAFSIAWTCDGEIGQRTGEMPAEASGRTAFLFCENPIKIPGPDSSGLPQHGNPLAPIACPAPEISHSGPGPQYCGPSKGGKCGPGRIPHSAMFATACVDAPKPVTCSPPEKKAIFPGSVFAGPKAYCAPGCSAGRRLMDIVPPNKIMGCVEINPGGAAAAKPR